MSCRMLIDISVTVDGRGVGRQLENDLTRIIHDRGTEAGIRISYRYGFDGSGGSDIPDTCGEVPEDGTHVTYGMGDPKPIVLGDDAGDVAHGWDDWSACRELHLFQTYIARQKGDTSQCKGCELNYVDCTNENCPDYAPCHDAGSGPHCAACPHSSVSPACPGSAGPVAAS